MSVATEHRTVDVVVHMISKEEAYGEVMPQLSDGKGEEKIVRMHYSLIGETRPVLSPLSIAYSFDDKTPAYRYDWLVGVATPTSSWDWQQDIRVTCPHE